MHNGVCENVISMFVVAEKFSACQRIHQYVSVRLMIYTVYICVYVCVRCKCLFSIDASFHIELYVSSDVSLYEYTQFVVNYIPVA